MGTVDRDLEPSAVRGLSLARVRDWCEPRLRGTLRPVVRRCAALGVTPNQLTVAGLLLNVLAAALVFGALPVIGGAVYLLAGLLDLGDGMLARENGHETPFGAFLDSTADRLSEGVMFAAIGYQCAVNGQPWLVVAVVVALLGSVLVSYARARAESLGVACRSGLMTRAERVVVLGFALLFGLLGPALVLLAVLGLVTVGQRVAEVHRALHG